MTEKKVTHEIKLDKSIKAILWGLVIAIMLHAIPQSTIIENAMAELGSNPQITILLGETKELAGYGNDGFDIDD